VILVDSSAWIEYFQNPPNTVAEQVYQALEDDFVVIGDLIYCAVLQGVKTAKMRNHIDELFSCLNQMPLAGFDIAQRAAKHHRDLREKGITFRKTIDYIIATFCIKNDIALIHAGHDFEAFERYFGLRGFRR
jgi:predicted nucleic acid-binding protein